MPPADPAPDEEAAYATKVEEAFIAERGTPFLLSPSDWRLIQAWYRGGVPLDTVVRAVHETFERRRARGAAGKIGSLSYCAGAVEERWEMERRGLAGATPLPDLPVTEAPERLARVREALAARLSPGPPGVDPAAWERSLAKALGKVDALDPSSGFDALEEKLLSAEASLCRSLLAALDAPARAALDAEVSIALGDVAAMPETLSQKMRRALERRELRRLLALPPLTLFDTGPA